jgi:hypothetical protein
MTIGLTTKDGINRHQIEIKELGVHQLGIFIFNISCRRTELNPYTYVVLDAEEIFRNIATVWQFFCAYEFAWNIFIMWNQGSHG